MRSYQLRARADHVAATRERIVAATMALHEEVGPAATTIAEIASRAGVSRPTVYNQFPDDGALFRACSAHFAATHPPPALTGLELEEALLAQYRYYAANEQILTHVWRDAETIPSLATVLEQATRRLHEAAVEIVRSLGRRGARAARARAFATLALELPAWRSLRRSGLDDEGAAALMASLVRVA